MKSLRVRAWHSATSATVDVPEIGTVRITAKRFKHKKGKRSMCFWTAEKALLD